MIDPVADLDAELDLVARRVALERRLEALPEPVRAALEEVGQLADLEHRNRVHRGEALVGQLERWLARGIDVDRVAHAARRIGRVPIDFADLFAGGTGYGEVVRDRDELEAEVAAWPEPVRAALEASDALGDPYADRLVAGLRRRVGIDPDDALVAFVDRYANRGQRLDAHGLPVPEPAPRAVETPMIVRPVLPPFGAHPDAPKPEEAPDEGEASWWTPLDLAAIAEGAVERPRPDVLERADGAGLLYRACINGVYGPSGVGKSWLWLYAARDVIRAGGRVLVIDLEATAEELLARFAVLGVEPAELAGSLDYLRPDSPLGWRALELLKAKIAERGYDLVVIDSLGELFALGGINENADAEVGPFIRNFLRPLADLGPAVLLVDHATKAGDHPLYPSGSKRKRAAVTGAMYLVDATDPFVAGKGGRVTLRCSKDRHGHYRQGALVGTLVMKPLEGDRASLTLYPPDDAGGDEGELKVVVLARKAYDAVEAEGGGPVTKRTLQELMQTRASAVDKRAGIELAESRGWLRMRQGPNRSHLFELGDTAPPGRSEGR